LVVKNIILRERKGKKGRNTGHVDGRQDRYTMEKPVELTNEPKEYH
jgi:hypothetical protein